jgi:uncharacterized protein YkwD
MNAIDFFLIAVLLFSIWTGWRKGFVTGAVDLLVLAATLLSAFWLYPSLSGLIKSYFTGAAKWSDTVSFVALVVIGRLLFGLIGNAILSSMPERLHDNTPNKVMGMAPGFINGLLHCVLLTALLIAVPISDGISKRARDSRLAAKFAEPAEWMQQKISPVFEDVMAGPVSHTPSSEEHVKLPFTRTDVVVRPDLEAQMLSMVNAERLKANLPLVKADPEMAEVARAHSRDMFARGYFSHNTPENKGPFDRMKQAGVVFATAGENLALGQTLSICHSGLMKSPGHRANILRPQFGRLGIGVIDGGKYGLMITQNFRN